MESFTLIRPRSLDAARTRALGAEGTQSERLYRAGGIDLLDLLKEKLIKPSELIELRALRDAHGEAMRALGIIGGRWHLGALSTLAAIHSSDLPEAFAALQEAAGSAATPSIRNSATLGGNLLQRPRCWYFRHRDLHCLKKGGGRCLAEGAENKFHAILGGGPCHIVHPSTLAVALVALRAELVIVGESEDKDKSRDKNKVSTFRTIPIESLFALPRVDPHREHTLAPGDVIREVVLPEPFSDQRSVYEVAKEKQSCDWPLAEVAISLSLRGGTIHDIRVGLGHVAPTPWRAVEFEEALEGQRPSAELFARVVPLATQGAHPLGENAYKIPLTQGLCRSALHRICAVDVPD